MGVHMFVGGPKTSALDPLVRPGRVIGLMLASRHSRLEHGREVLRPLEPNHKETAALFFYFFLTCANGKLLWRAQKESSASSNF